MVAGVSELRAWNHQHAFRFSTSSPPSRRSDARDRQARIAYRAGPRADPAEPIRPVLEERVDDLEVGGDLTAPSRPSAQSPARRPMIASTSEGAEEQIVV